MRTEVCAHSPLTRVLFTNGRYAQDAILSRLLRLVRPKGYLVIVGLEPYELQYDPADAVRRFEALGDAAALLAGTESYREMPQVRWDGRVRCAAGVRGSRSSICRARVQGRVAGALWAMRRLGWYPGLSVWLPGGCWVAR